MHAGRTTGQSSSIPHSAASQTYTQDFLLPAATCLRVVLPLTLPLLTWTGRENKEGKMQIMQFCNLLVGSWRQHKINHDYQKPSYNLVTDQSSSFPTPSSFSHSAVWPDPGSLHPHWLIMVKPFMALTVGKRSCLWGFSFWIPVDFSPCHPPMLASSELGCQSAVRMPPFWVP